MGAHIDVGVVKSAIQMRHGCENGACFPANVHVVHKGCALMFVAAPAHGLHKRYALM